MGSVRFPMKKGKLFRISFAREKCKNFRFNLFHEEMHNFQEIIKAKITNAKISEEKKIGKFGVIKILKKK